MRRAVGRAVIAGLCLAAAAAILALATGEFDDTPWRVIVTSVGFSFFSALGGSGEALRREAHDWRAVLGGLTTAAAVLAFVLLVGATWIDDDDETLLRAFGLCGLTSLCGSHASLVLRARRRDDSPLVTFLVWTSIVTATFETLVGDIAIVGAVDDVSDDFVRLLAAVLVVTVLSSVLPPLQRRLAGEAPRAHPSDPGEGAHAGRRPISPSELADEIAAVARRLDDVGMPVDVRREAAVLRDLAARARR